MKMKTILIVDDDISICNTLKRILTREGHQVLCAYDMVSGMNFFHTEHVDAVLLDMQLPDGNGIDIGKTMTTENPHIPVILITAFAEIDKAVSAIKNGLYDFIKKPFERERIIITLRNALSLSDSLQMNNSLKQNTQASYQMIGQSPTMLNIYQLIDRLGPLEAPLLILGEHGVGKDLVANAMHLHSTRAGKKMVKLNCSAIPESLIEAELFGHTRGAFTGANFAREGYIQTAHKSTLFLDEIGDLSLNAQAKILRFLESGEIQKVGSNQIIQIDARIIAATNRNLTEMVQNKLFREDLYYRLEVLPVHIPPLRERATDIELLTDFFLQLYAEKYGVPRPQMTPAAKNYFYAYDWPGNVRQLKHCIERLVILTDANPIDLPHVLTNLQKTNQEQKTSVHHQSLRQAKDEFEKEHILRILQQTGGNVTQAAQLLGVERRNLYRKMKDLGLK